MAEQKKQPSAGAQPAVDWSQLAPASGECRSPQVLQFIFAKKVIDTRPSPPPLILLLLVFLLLLAPAPGCRRCPEGSRRTKHRR